MKTKRMYFGSEKDVAHSIKIKDNMATVTLKILS